MVYQYERPREFKVVVLQLFQEVGHYSCDDEGGDELEVAEDVEGEGWVRRGFGGGFGRHGEEILNNILKRE
jgi:hypothetical protein